MERKRETRTKIVGGALVVAGAALCGAYLWQRASAPPAAAGPLAAPTETAAGGDPPAVTANQVEIARVEDDRAARDPAFRAEGAGWHAAGVSVDAEGSLEVTSQEGGGVLRQRVLALEAVGAGAASRVLPRPPPAPPRLLDDPGRGALRFPSFAEGVDLEYTYDGKDVEELFHLDDALHAGLRERGEGLRVRALLPGLRREDGVALDGLGGALVSSPEPRARAGAEGADAPAPGALPPGIGGAWASFDAVEINFQGHRFALPPAVAIAGDGARLALERRFWFGDEGLHVDFEVPAAWLARAQGPIVIDPSVVDSGRYLQAYTWQERNIVRDDLGRLHVTYMAVVNGRWHAMYVSGDGERWSVPVVIAQHGRGENTHYTPNLVIDSQGTLHALWADWGYGPSNPEQRGAYGGWVHRLHFASCPNRCQLGLWSFAGTAGGTIVTGSSAAHHAYHTLAVDRDDVVHVMFEEQSPYRTRYFQVAGGVISEKTAPVHAYHSSMLIVDANNTLHALNSDYYNNYDVRHFVWDASAQQWSGRANFPRVVAAGCTAYHSHHGAASLDANGDIHFTNQQYLCGTWMATYGKYSVASDSWSGVTSLKVLEQGYLEQGYQEHVPSITVDDGGAVHVLFRRDKNFQEVLYTTKPSGGSWSTPARFLRANDNFGPPQLRPRHAWPRSAAGTPFNVVSPAQIDAVIAESGGILRYVRLGAPLTAPDLRSPPDHAFVTAESSGAATCRPQLVWSRVLSDIDTTTRYRVEVSSSPAFIAGGLNQSFDAGASGTLTLPSGLLSNGNVYYWRVQAYNSAGRGPYSRVYEVGCDTVAPAAFNLIAPAEGADPGTKTPTLEWETGTP